MNSSSVVRLAILIIFMGLGRAQSAPVTVENEYLAVSWDAVTHKLTFTAKPSGRTFVRNAALSRDYPTTRTRTISHQIFGRGRALEFSDANDNRDVVMLFP